MKQRRSFAPEFKAKVVLEVISGVKSPAEVCCQHHLKPPLLCGWKAPRRQKASLVFQTEEQRSQEQAHIAELERLVGRMTLHIEILKEASSVLGALPHRDGS